MENQTPFYITITKISENSKERPLNDKAIFLAPKSSESIELRKPLVPGSNVFVNNINDYGANISKVVNIT